MSFTVKCWLVFLGSGVAIISFFIPGFNTNSHVPRDWTALIFPAAGLGLVVGAIAYCIILPPSKIILEIGYSIDYEDEKEEYDFDENGMVVLIDGRRMSWEDVLLDGFDYIAISYINDNGEMIQFLDAELA